eukprot:3908488-Prorocentrum_lima.AAC.1
MFVRPALPVSLILADFINHGHTTWVVVHYDAEIQGPTYQKVIDLIGKSDLESFLVKEVVAEQLRFLV